MANKQSSGHRGEVKDPEHDGRLKGHHGGEADKAHSSEGREGGEENDRKSEGKRGSHAKGGQEEKQGKSNGQSDSGSGGGDDLKAREYRDAEGNVHHHTKKYAEQHRGE